MVSKFFSKKIHLHFLSPSDDGMFRLPTKKIGGNVPTSAEGEKSTFGRPLPERRAERTPHKTGAEKTLTVIIHCSK